MKCLPSLFILHKHQTEQTLTVGTWKLVLCAECACVGVTAESDVLVFSLCVSEPLKSIHFPVKLRRLFCGESTSVYTHVYLPTDSLVFHQWLRYV